MGNHSRAGNTPGGATIDIADAVMLGVIAVWAGNNVLTKAALEDGLSPIIYVVLRFAIAAALLFVVLRMRGAQLAIERADFRRFLVTGISGYALYNLLFVVGLDHTTAFSAAILVALAPVFTLVLSTMLGLEQVRAKQWAGIAIALAGVGIFLGDKLRAGNPAIGDLLNILAALSFAVYGIAAQPLVIRYGAPMVTAWSALIGLIAVIPVGLVPVLEQDWTEMGRLSWSAILYGSVISMLVAYSLWSWAITRRGAGRTVPYLFLIPVVTGTLAVLFLDEHLSPGQLIGGAIAPTGVAIARGFAGRASPGTRD